MDRDRQYLKIDIEVLHLDLTQSEDTNHNR